MTMYLSQLGRIIEVKEKSVKLEKVIQMSYQLLEQSSQLINAALTAVEIAIEWDDKTALKYIENNLN